MSTSVHADPILWNKVVQSEQKKEATMRKSFIILLLIFSVALFIGCTKQDTVIPDVKFTAATLAEYDGQDGRPAYIAIDGLVYDVSNHKSWTNGEHHGFEAGKDLSAEFKENHKEGTLRKLPVVGTYADAD
jgi:predicted heme/steroid binding protein